MDIQVVELVDKLSVVTNKTLNERCMFHVKSVNRIDVVCNALDMIDMSWSRV